MDVVYTFDESQDLWIAFGESADKMKCFHSDADTFEELQERVGQAIESLHLDERDKSLKEGFKSFTKFFVPKPNFIKVEFDTFYD